MKRGHIAKTTTYGALAALLTISTGAFAAEKFQLPHGYRPSADVPTYFSAPARSAIHQPRKGWHPTGHTNQGRYTPSHSSSRWRPSRTASRAPAIIQTAATVAAKPIQQFVPAEKTAEIGLDGYCPVALRDHRKKTKGDERFQSTYGGATYVLSSLEAKAAFDADPKKYAPANGGQDVVAANGSGIPGRLQHGVWFRNRLYLFATAETLQKFTAAPRKFEQSY